MDALEQMKKYIELAGNYPDDRGGYIDNMDRAVKFAEIVQAEQLKRIADTLQYLENEWREE